MFQPATLKNVTNVALPAIGVGLRHQHFSEALSSCAPIDFVEIHSENFFADGGATIAVLDEIIFRYAVSLHCTAMGLGSAKGVPNLYQKKLARLVDKVNPALFSDHASYSWSDFHQYDIHAGDLLPISFNEESLIVLANNVDHAQQFYGRKILIENLSSYIQWGNNTMSEVEYLVRLTEMTECGLLLDLNNIIVTANNLNVENNLLYAIQWMDQLPVDVVGEIHLAGFSHVPLGELVIDDHSQAVSTECWKLYEYAIAKFGAIPTLIEWDNNLPSWQRLLEEAETAKKISSQVIKSVMNYESM